MHKITRPHPCTPTGNEGKRYKDKILHFIMFLEFCTIGILSLPNSTTLKKNINVVLINVELNSTAVLTENIIKFRGKLFMICMQYISIHTIRM